MAKIKDVFWLNLAISGDTIDLPEGTFEFTGEPLRMLHTGYLSKVGEDGSVSLTTHVRDSRGVALLPVKTLVELIQTNAYIVY